MLISDSLGHQTKERHVNELEDQEDEAAAAEGCNLPSRASIARLQIDAKATKVLLGACKGFTKLLAAPRQL